MKKGMAMLMAVCMTAAMTGCGGNGAAATTAPGSNGGDGSGSDHGVGGKNHGGAW